MQQSLTADRLPEFKEYLVGGLSFLASPADIESLQARRKKDDDLDRILRRFQNPTERQAMFREAWKRFDLQCEHKYKNKAKCNFIIFGVGGIGKSMVALTMMSRCADIFQVSTGIRPLMDFARNPAEINSALAKVTELGKPGVIDSDEAEHDVAQDSATEEQAFIDNVETSRLLQPTVFRCVNRFEVLRTFSHYCDFVFEVVFSDRTHRINYAIMYRVDSHSERKDGLEPVAIINVPLHSNQSFIDQYEAIKCQDETEFALSGGRHSSVKVKLEFFAQKLVDYIIDNHLDRKQSAKSLQTKLILHIDQGDKQTGTMQELIVADALERLKEYDKGKPQDPADPPDKEPEFTWSSDFDWAEKIAALIQKHRQFKRHYKVFVASVVLGLNATRNRKEFSKITGKERTQNNDYLRDMNEKDLAFKGWLIQKRSVMHEKFVAQKLRRDGWAVTEKPHFQYGDRDYEEDLYAEKDDRQVWLNCKCGEPRTYTSEEYLTTWILANELNAEAYILYLNPANNENDIWFPEDQISVGITPSPLTRSAKSASGAPSTPLLLLAALRTQPIPEPTDDRSPTKHGPKARPKTRPKPKAKPHARAKPKHSRR